MKKARLKGSVQRLKLIARQNTQSAFMATTYQRQIANQARRPYWQYLAVMDASTRDSHAALHNKVLRADDPIWDSIYRPMALTAAAVSAPCHRATCSVWGCRSGLIMSYNSKITKPNYCEKLKLISTK